MSSFLKKSRRVEMGVRVLVDSCRASLQSKCYVTVLLLVELIWRRNNWHLSWSWRQGKSQPESLVEDVRENVGEDEHEDDADPSREEEKPPWKAVGSQNVQEDL